MARNLRTRKHSHMKTDDYYMMEGKTKTDNCCEGCRCEQLCSPVIVIGNGPSAMCLSFFLSGHWPYYNGLEHPNPYLQSRLKESPEKSLVAQDLQYLSEGLEGRSRHPVALLFDSLQHPNADQGDRMPSRMGFIEDPDNTIPHMVLGSGLPGGSWLDLDVSVLTLSLGCWMELPGQDFKEWIAKYRSSKDSQSPFQAHQLDRATLGEVARYYQSYVKDKKLEKYFVSHTLVTSVRRLKGKRVVNRESGEPETTCKKCSGIEGDNIFEVKGVNRGNCGCERPFSILTKNVVMATGMLGMPNKLNVEGENLNFIKTKVQDLEAAFQGSDLDCASSRVLVVGAGLSAADAIQCCLNADIPVVHVFRRRASDHQIALARLPKAVYPEYHEVLELMKGGKEDPRYTPLAEHQVERFLPDHSVVLRGPGEAKQNLSISIAAVLIGSLPDLSFLPEEGRHMGFHKDQPISYKNNPIMVDPFTMEVHNEPGLYAMGPLVGDNFVRFSLGGAMAITKHLVSKGCVKENVPKMCKAL